MTDSIVVVKSETEFPAIESFTLKSSNQFKPNELAQKENETVLFAVKFN